MDVAGCRLDFSPGVVFAAWEVPVVLVVFDHLLDVLVVVEDYASDLGKRKHACHTKIL